MNAFKRTNVNHALFKWVQFYMGTELNECELVVHLYFNVVLQ